MLFSNRHLALILKSIIENIDENESEYDRGLKDAYSAIYRLMDIEV